MYGLTNIIRIKSRRIRWAGHVARMGEGSSYLKMLTGKPTEKRPLGSLSLRSENNIKKGQEIGLIQLRIRIIRSPLPMWY